VSACTAIAPAAWPPGTPIADVRSTLGGPTGEYRLPDGGTRLEFARGSFGRQTYMLDFDADGDVRSGRPTHRDLECGRAVAEAFDAEPVGAGHDVAETVNAAFAGQLRARPAELLLEGHQEHGIRVAQPASEHVEREARAQHRDRRVSQVFSAGSRPNTWRR